MTNDKLLIKLFSSLIRQTSDFNTTMVTGRSVNESNIAMTGQLIFLVSEKELASVSI